MQCSFDESIARELFHSLALSRGSLGRWRSLVEAREQDGLDLADAELEVADSMGFLEEIESALREAFQPLCDGLESPPEALHLRDARDTMPTLHSREGLLRLDLPPLALEALLPIAARLVERLAQEPERSAVTVEAGLGGTGGCATGACLPEDAPPGPLFERSSARRG